MQEGRPICWIPHDAEGEDDEWRSFLGCLGAFVCLILLLIPLLFLGVRAIGGEARGKERELSGIRQP
jgi:hypothetical protein